MIEEIPVLVERENKKSRKMKVNSSSQGQKEEFGMGFQNARKAMAASDAFYGSKKDGHHED